MLNMRELARRHVENERAIEVVSATPVGVQLGAKKFNLQTQLLKRLETAAAALRHDVDRKYEIEQRLEPLMEKLDNFSATLAKRVSDRLLPEVYARMAGHLEERLINYFKFYAPHVVEEQAEEIAKRVLEALETGKDISRIFRDKRIPVDDADSLVDYLLDENIKLQKKIEDQRPLDDDAPPR